MRSRAWLFNREFALFGNRFPFVVLEGSAHGAGDVLCADESSA